MEKNRPKYWKGLEELNREPEFEKNRFKEFAEQLPLGNIVNEEELGLSSTRRDFLKFMGFSVTAATLAACSKTPIKKIVPFVNKPSEVEPGIADYYATTCGVCSSGCTVIAKNKDGRPIKLEGNAEFGANLGGVCASGHASILDLYDSGRLDGALVGGKKTAWAEVDKKVINGLKEIANAGGKVVFMTGTVTSPSTKRLIAQFVAKYPTAKHVIYEPVSFSAMLDAHGKGFGKRVLPSFDISKAKTMVSFGADFLGTWLSNVEFAKQYSAARKVDDGQKSILKHFQFETNLSLSGSNADIRAVLSPSQMGAALVRLHNYIAEKLGKATAGTSNLELMGNSIKAAAEALVASAGESLVVCGTNNLDHQMIVAAINSMLGNYGKTIKLGAYSHQKAGNDAEVAAVVEEIKNGQVSGLIIGAGINPVYSMGAASGLAEALKKMKLSVSLSERLDETAMACQIVAPVSHYLESWNDSMAKEGMVSLTQPTIQNIFDTRSMGDSLLAWTEQGGEYYDYIQATWREMLLGKQSTTSDFKTFWVKSLEIGGMKYDVAETAATFAGDVATSATKLSATKTAGIEVVIYESLTLRDGQMANNPWLQELPDPITKICWDNYVLVSPVLADKEGFKDEDVVEITINGKAAKLPVVRQPGLKNNTIAVALGYGRKADEKAGKVMNGVGGFNAYNWVTTADGYRVYDGHTATLKKTGDTYQLARTQTHHHIEGRDLVRETSIGALLNGNAGEPAGVAHHKMSMYQDYRSPGHKWALVVDLNACTGCSACIVSCSAENNVPVVGKDEVRRRRDMAWLRMDRYYSIADNKQEYQNKYKIIDEKLENNALDYENVRVVFQPMLCQHCDNAPCENVCPVNAISHSSEGINQQIYNRCVGTKYCANNCPYKVRRFNYWKYAMNDKFDYYMNDDLGRMVLNPDVTVRMRGVMEKCSFCVQRIQAGKLEAKKEGRALKDGDIKTACSQSCPSNAITFGDVNDKNSEVYKLVNGIRNYEILTELNTRPAVHYLSKVRAVDKLS